MAKEIIIENGNMVNSTDYKAKAEKIIEELGNTVFSKFDNSEEFENQRFYKNQINPILTPMQVTSKLNRLLRVYKPLSQSEAETIPDTEYLEAFGYYCDIISYINEYLVYLPDKQTFSAFVNITTDIYNEFLLNNPKYQQVFKSFEDSFNSTNFLSAQSGLVDGKVTMAKLQTKDAGHNLVKNPESLVVNNYNKIDKQEMQLAFDKLESMTRRIGNKGDKQ